MINEMAPLPKKIGPSDIYEELGLIYPKSLKRKNIVFIKR